MKLVPIEVHEIIDSVWSLGVIAAPFLFGRSRRGRLANWMHVLVGASTLLASLFTDYRAQRGVQWFERRSSARSAGAGGGVELAP